MQNNVIPKEPKSLIVKSEPIEVVFSDDSMSRLSLVLPPFDDLNEITAFTGHNFSVKDIADHHWEPYRQAFEIELTSLQKKQTRFGNSKTFVSHLANLAEMAGQRELEYEILKRGLSNGTDSLLALRLGENLHSRGLSEEAERWFAIDANTQNPIAKLRVAFFYAQRRDTVSASRIVASVVAENPTHYGARLFEGALRLATGNIPQAIQSFKIAEGERPNSSVLMTNLGIAYFFAKKIDKALCALRKAVALDPLNQNAVSILADIANAHQRDEEAVPALRYFVSLEQRVASVWGRLARSLVHIGNYDEAIAALRRQATQEDTSAVWNNLGVAHLRNKNRHLAISAFKHSIQKMKLDAPEDGLIAVRNTMSMLVEEKHFHDVIRLAKLAVDAQRALLIRSNKKLGDIYLFWVHAIRQVKGIPEATILAEDLLKLDDLSPNLKFWLFTQLLAHYSLSISPARDPLEFAKYCKNLLDELESADDSFKEGFINNLTFALVDNGALDEAATVIPLMSKFLHKHPYPTATLGLLNLRKGKIEKGAALYEEAVRIAASREDKQRIRQKFNLEMGLAFKQLDSRQAVRYLKKASTENEGVPELKQRALAELRILTSA